MASRESPQVPRETRCYSVGREDGGCGAPWPDLASRASDTRRVPWAVAH